MSDDCLTCGGSGVLVDCHGGACSHINDREWPCPACAAGVEVGDEPEETATCVCCGAWLDGERPPYCRDCHAKACP